MTDKEELKQAINTLEAYCNNHKGVYNDPCAGCILQVLNSIYEKYESLCDSFSDCSECPMRFVEINRFEVALTVGVLKTP